MSDASPTLREALHSKYRTLFSTIGSIIAVVSLCQLLPLLPLVWYPEERHLWPCFVIPSLVGLSLGLGLRWGLSSKRPYILSVQDGGILVVVVWGVAMLLGAFPFLLSGSAGPLNALFESVSGWTTTGLSVLDVGRTAHSLLFWRSLTQYLGGLGVVLIAILAIIGTSAQSLYLAEGRSDQLRPHIRNTALVIFGINGVLLALMAVIYWLGGMSPFDALNHAMCTVSTGGFSTQAASFAQWGSPFLYITGALLMLIAATNYSTHFALREGNWRAVLHNPEWHLAAVLLLLSVSLVFLGLAAHPAFGLSLKGLQVAFFESVSALSTTGFTSANYQGWPDLPLFVLTTLMLIGGGTGSTAGGIKQYRVYLLLKSIGWHVQKRLLPRRAVVRHHIWSGNRWQEVDEREIAIVAAFTTLFVGAYLLGVVVFLAYGYPLRESLFEMASSIGTVGLSVGITGPTAPAGIRLVEMAAMIAGRLEFYVLVLGPMRLIHDIKLFRKREA